jgi:nicotinate-nucleotide pyrophosphorylase (carboxylating)
LTSSSLYEAVLIKDNRIAVAGSITAAVLRVRGKLGETAPIQVEVDSLTQLEEALSCHVAAVLLDNMAPDELRRAVSLVAGRCQTEASGGITPDNVRENSRFTGSDLDRPPPGPGTRSWRG